MNKKLLKEQSGMAAIMFAMFIVIVISLIAFGFAVIVRNDQRQTLDKTLSNQAIYAAESAINKKQRDIAAGVGEPTNINDCDLDPIAQEVLNTEMPGVTIACLTWNKAPDDITFNNVGSNPAITRIATDSSAINSLRITWAKSGTVIFDGELDRLVLSTMPTLRITVAQERDINNVRTAFINPQDNGTVIEMTDVSGIIGDADCSDNTCTALIRDLPGTWNNGQGYGWISISSLNGISDPVTIRAYSSMNATDSPVSIVGAQAEIDATAKSQDVIKRLKARVSLIENTWRPGFAVMADELCKNYAVNGSFGNDDTYSGMVRSGSPSALCPAE